MSVYFSSGDDLPEMFAAEARQQETAKTWIRDFQWKLMDGEEHYFLSIESTDPPVLSVGRIQPLEEVDKDIRLYLENEDIADLEAQIEEEKESVRYLLKQGLPRNVTWDGWYHRDSADYHTVHASKMLEIPEEVFHKIRELRQDLEACMEDRELRRWINRWIVQVHLGI